MKQETIVITAGLDADSLLTRIIIKDLRDPEKMEIVGEIIDFYEEEWKHNKAVKYLVLQTDLGYEIKLTLPTSGGSEA